MQIIHAGGYFDGTPKPAHNGRMRSLFILLAVVLLMGCGSIPEGYTEESWAWLQRNDPERANAVKRDAENRAQIIKYINGNYHLKTLNAKAIAILKDDRDLLLEWNTSFTAACELSMNNNIDIKAALSIPYGKFQKVTDVKADKRNQILEAIRSI